MRLMRLAKFTGKILHEKGKNYTFPLLHLIRVKFKHTLNIFIKFAKLNEMT